MVLTPDRISDPEVRNVGHRSDDDFEMLDRRLLLLPVARGHLHAECHVAVEILGWYQAKTVKLRDRNLPVATIDLVALGQRKTAGQPSYLQRFQPGALGGKRANGQRNGQILSAVGVANFQLRRIYRARQNAHDIDILEVRGSSHSRTRGDHPGDERESWPRDAAQPTGPEVSSAAAVRFGLVGCPEKRRDVRLPVRRPVTREKIRAREYARGARPGNALERAGGRTCGLLARGAFRTWMEVRFADPMVFLKRLRLRHRRPRLRSIFSLLSADARWFQFPSSRSDLSLSSIPRSHPSLASLACPGPAEGRLSRPGK